MKKTIMMWAAVAALFMASCREKEDNTAPEIISVSVNGMPGDEVELQAGDNFTVAISVSDNEALNQVKLNVHAADDGHSHDGGSGEEVGPNVGVWSETNIYNLSGTSADESWTYQVPANVAGYWHLEVLLMDEAGNEAEEFIVTLHVTNQGIPVFNLTSTPAPVDGEIVIAPGGNVIANGTITDSDGLATLEVEVENDAEEVVWSTSVDMGDVTDYTVSALEIPFATAGHYHIHFRANDNGGMYNLLEWEVHVE